MQRDSLDELSNGIMAAEQDPLLSETMSDNSYVQSRDAPSYTGAERLRGDSTPWGAVFIVVNAALGAGLLAFPYAFFQAGGPTDWYWGLLMEVVSL